MAERTRKSFVDRFWSKVNKDGPAPAHLPELGPCWLWTKKPNGQGYGRTCLDYKVTMAHRASWEIVFGPIPDGLCVLHRCDVRLCVRPDHLFLGTRQDNMADKMAKGRHIVGRMVAGEAHYRARLTEAKVTEMRRRYAAGETRKDLAAQFDVCLNTVRQVVTGYTWRHVA